MRGNLGKKLPKNPNFGAEFPCFALVRVGKRHIEWHEMMPTWENVNVLIAHCPEIRKKQQKRANSFMRRWSAWAESVFVLKRASMIAK